MKTSQPPIENVLKRYHQIGYGVVTGLVSRLRSHQIQPEDMLPKIEASFCMFFEEDIVFEDVVGLREPMLFVLSVAFLVAVASQLYFAAISKVKYSKICSYSPKGVIVPPE